MKRALTQNRMLFALYALLTLASILLIFNMLISYSAGWAGRPSVFLAALSFMPSLAIFAVLLPRWKASPEKVFLLVAVPALLAFAFFMMMGAVPDEMNHIRRAFTLEQPGNDMMIPTCLISENYPNTYGELADKFGASYDLSDLTPANYNMAAYLPHLYIIPYIFMKIATALGVNMFVALYIGRLTSVVLYLVGGYWIIRLMPMARVFMAVYLLNPMILQQEASLSADVVTNVVTLLYIALVLRARFSEKLTWKTFAVIGVFFVLMALSKFIYALFIFLLLLLVPRISDKKRRMGIYIGTAVVTLVAAYLALFVFTWGEYQSSFDLIKDPVECARVLKNTIIEVSPSYVTMFFGQNLGSFTVGMWQPATWAYIIVFAMSLVFNLGESNALERKEKVFVAGLVIAFSVILILFFRYWATQSDGIYDYITGVQGRYFLPFLNLGLVCCITRRSSLVRENCMIVYAIAIGLILAIDMIRIIAYFA